MQKNHPVVERQKLRRRAEQYSARRAALEAPIADDWRHLSGRSCIMFIDLDGVLLMRERHTLTAVLGALRGGAGPDYWRTLFSPRSVKMLTALHDEFRPLYVFTSEWMQFISFSELLEIFFRTELRFLATNTHHSWNLTYQGNKERAVEEWERSYLLPGQRVVVIESPNNEWNLVGQAYRNHNHVVVCASPLGLTKSNFERARQSLSLRLDCAGEA